MNRRHCFRALTGLALWPWIGGATLTLTGCGGRDPGKGAIEIIWDRDPCERCRMIISDRFHAAQIRDADGKIHLFDDVGCAFFWSEQHGLTDRETEFWITDFRAHQWIDARQAQYVGGRTTPMGYGFGGTLEPIESSLTLADARARILARGK